MTLDSISTDLTHKGHTRQCPPGAQCRLQPSKALAAWPYECHLLKQLLQQCPRHGHFQRIEAARGKGTDKTERYPKALMPLNKIKASYGGHSAHLKPSRHARLLISGW